MLPRHTAEMMSMIERVCDLGTAEVSAWTLKRWFDQKRLTKAMFRTLDQHFTEVSEGNLMFIGDLEGSYVFIDAQGLTADDKSFFKPIEPWLANWRSA